MAAAEQLSLLGKLVLVRRTLRNWPLVIVDKLGLRRTVTYETRAGTRVICRGRSSDVNETVAIHAGIEYPADLLRLPAGACVFDVGANIGAFALFVTSLNPGTRLDIVAFEPYAPNAALLRRNLAANREGRVTVAELAIASEDGRGHLETTGDFDQVRLVPEATGTVVNANRLSSYCAKQGIDRIDLLKLDIEGAEYAVLEREAEWLGSHASALLIEYHDLGPDRSPRRLTEILEPHFTLRTLHSGSVTGVVHARSREL